MEAIYIELLEKLNHLEHQISNLQPQKKYFSLAEAAEYLGLSKQTLYGKINTLPHYKQGNRIFFKPDELDHWVELGRRSPK